MRQAFNPSEMDHIGIIQERGSVTVENGEEVYTWVAKFTNVKSKRINPLAGGKGTESESERQPVNKQRDSWIMWKFATDITPKMRYVIGNSVYNIVDVRTYVGARNMIVIDTIKNDNESDVSLSEVTSLTVSNGDQTKAAGAAIDTITLTADQNSIITATDLPSDLTLTKLSDTVATITGTAPSSTAQFAVTARGVGGGIVSKAIDLTITAVAYSPADEGTGVCKVLYEASTTADDLVLSSLFVTQIADSSGNGQDTDTQGTTSLRPITSNLYGNRTVFWMGTNALLVSITTIPQPFSIFVACRYTGRDVDTAYFLRTQDSGNDLSINYQALFSQLQMSSGGTSLTKTGVLETDVIGQSIVFEFEFNGASSNIRLNNSVIATGNAGTNSLTDFVLGSNRTPGSNGFIGHYSSFWVMAGTLTTTQRNNSYNYGLNLLT